MITIKYGGRTQTDSTYFIDKPERSMRGRTRRCPMSGPSSATLGATRQRRCRRARWRTQHERGPRSGV
jgi:hypothetical protein